MGLVSKNDNYCKKVGGPINLGLLVSALGAVAGAFGGIVCYKHFTKNSTSENDNSLIYGVTVAGTDGQGLSFEVGDTFKVLEIADDSVLIEKIGDNYNPYSVSKHFLESISDFKTNITF